MEFLNIGLGELLLILLIALLVFGPERLPSVLRQSGRTIGQFREAVTQLQTLIMQESEPIRRTIDETRTTIDGAVGPVREVGEQLTASNPAAQLQKVKDETVAAVTGSYKPLSRQQPEDNASTAQGDEMPMASAMPSAAEPSPANDPTSPRADDATQETSVEPAPSDEIQLRSPAVPPIARGHLNDDEQDDL
ncbi:MAG: twin-arginine translocase TatA/TatE family subunit [Anaerolineales bacterium]|nr:twin-arginine translocase TatA/TatE family subunit [Anaerolineales bacterium]